jgi:hypothetical protein
MLDEEVLKSVAAQLMSAKQVEAAGKQERVERTSSQRLRTVHFEMNGREYQAIEQNPEKPSRWGKLAREGRHVVQIRDVEKGKYVAAVVDGRVTVYGKRRP